MEDWKLYKSLIPGIQIKEIFTCFYQKRKADYRFPGERHPYFELTYVDRGTLNTTVDGVPHSLNQFDMMLYYPRQFHTQSTDKDRTCSYLTVTFSMNCEDSLKGLLKNKVIKVSEKVYKHLSVFIQAIRSDMYLSNELAILELEKVLINAFQVVHQEQYPQTREESEYIGQDVYFQRILDYITQNLYSPLSVDEICKEFSLSRSTLQAMFKENMRQSPKQYISKLKLEESKRLIHKHQYTISEISDRLGFTSIHYFSRKFKMEYGLSPSEYAKSIQP